VPQIEGDRPLNTDRVLHGLGFPQDIKDGIAAGADAYLVKPFTGDLAETLRNTIEEKKLRSATPTLHHYSPLCNSAARP
jgi:hypothetical protein